MFQAILNDVIERLDALGSGLQIQQEVLLALSAEKRRFAGDTIEILERHTRLGRVQEVSGVAFLALRGYLIILVCLAMENGLDIHTIAL